MTKEEKTDLLRRLRRAYNDEDLQSSVNSLFSIVEDIIESLSE